MNVFNSYSYLDIILSRYTAIKDEEKIMPVEKDLPTIAMMLILNEFSGKIELSKALKLKDFKGSQALVEKLDDHSYRIYVKALDESDCPDVFDFEVEIDSPIEGSVIYRKMDISVDIEEKLAYSKKKLRVAEAVHRLLKKSILFPEYDKEI